MALSPDGSTLALAGAEAIVVGQVSLWNVNAAKQIRTLDEREEYESFDEVAFSPDGSIVVAAGNTFGTVQTWQASTGKKLMRLKGHAGPVSRVTFSPDGRTLAAAGGETVGTHIRGSSRYIAGEAKLWDVESGRAIVTFTGHTSKITSSAFTSDGNTLVTGSIDGTLKLWKVHPDQGLTLFEDTDCKVHGLALHPKGSIIAGVVSSKGGRLRSAGVRVWDFQSGQEQTRFWGMHEVRSVTFSPDGKTLAVGGNSAFGSGYVDLYETGAFGKPTSIVIEDVQVNKVNFSPDGTILAVALGYDWNNISHRYNHGEIRLYDTASKEWKEWRTIAAKSWGSIVGMAFSPNGDTLATAAETSGFFTLWDVRSGVKRGTLGPLTGGVRALAFSPDGMILAAGSDAQDEKRKGSSPITLRLFDVATRSTRATLRGHTGGVRDVAFAPDGQTLFSAGDDGTVKLWDVSSGQAQASLRGRNGPVTCVTLDRSGTLLVTGAEGGSVRVWKGTADAERAVLQFDGWFTNVNDVRWSRDGKRIMAISSNEGSELYETGVWDAGTGYRYPNRGVADSPDFDRDGKILADVIHKQTELRLRSIPEDTELATYRVQDGEIMNTCFSQDAKLVAIATPTSVDLWNVVTRRKQHHFEGGPGDVQTMDFSPDGRRFMSSWWTRDSNKKFKAGVIKLWDVETGREIAVLEGGIGNSIFSPDGKILASAGADHQIMIYDGITGRRLQSLKGHDGDVWGLEFNSDGNTLATACHGKRVIVWDVVTWQQQAAIRTHPDGLSSMSISPDGKMVATGGEDRRVRLWDAVTGKQRKILQGHVDAVLSLSFSPDGNLLASGGRDGSVRLWDCNSVP
jgi:WD40 repeat protein